MAVKLSELLALPVEERLKLVEALWESVAECPEALELSRRSRSSIVGSQRTSATRRRAYLGLS
jgi:putative addiction module component (TIGR02574 family)